MPCWRPTSTKTTPASRWAGPARWCAIFSTADGSVVQEIRKHTDWIYALEFSPDGVLLATADRSGGLFVWEAETVREYQNLQGHKGPVTDVAWRLDSNLLATRQRRRHDQALGNGKRHAR